MQTAWKCEVCGFVHEAAEPPEFCPVCGAARDSFRPMVLGTGDRPAPQASTWRCSNSEQLHPGAAPPESCPVCDAPNHLFEPVAAETAAALSGEVRRVVIVGGGIAGLTAAAEARRAAPAVAVTLISKETGLPYYRLNLTRFLAGEIDADALLMQQHAWYEQQRIERLQGEVGDLGIDRREVRLLDGRTVPYDRLILANGSHPYVPSLAGVTREGVTVLRTLSDARAILQRLRSVKRCVCIGGGLLGLETAGALNRQGLQVTILEGQDWLLPRQLPHTGGDLLRRQVEAKGIAVRCGVQVRELTGDEHVRGVRLADDSELPADLVILAAGVRPNSYLGRLSGLKVHTGILVDDRMTTSHPAILAAGDIAEHRGRLYGIWPASYAQGVVAGRNAVGGSAEFTGLPPATRLKVLDLELFSSGVVNLPDASYRLVEMQDQDGYRALVCRDGAVVGAALLGRTELAGILTEAIGAATPLAELPGVILAFPELAAR
jgi:nitrite reductase (NADH) large subunit